VACSIFRALFVCQANCPIRPTAATTAAAVGGSTVCWPTPPRCGEKPPLPLAAPSRCAARPKPFSTVPGLAQAGMTARAFRFKHSAANRSLPACIGDNSPPRMSSSRRPTCTLPLPLPTM
jgi:hypothetical protein